MGKFANFLAGKKRTTGTQKFSWVRAIAFVLFTVAVIVGGRFIVVGLPEVKTNVWFDTDCLPDDNVALAMVLANRKTLNLCGVSVQALNADHKIAIKNALSLLSLFGAKNVPVVDGAHNTLLQRRQTCIDEQYALGDLQLEDNGKNYTAADGLLYMRNEILSLPSDEKITIVAIAPLTTEAILLKTFPDVASKIERIIIMGGAINIQGNAAPHAEFNAFQDPEALDVILKSGVPIVMVPLDITQRLQVTNEEFEPLLKSDKEELVMIGQLIERIANSREEYKGQVAPIHDMVSIQYLTRPENFTGYYANVEVVLEGNERGRVIATQTNDKNNKNAVYIVSDCLQENFISAFKEDLKNLTDYIYYFKAKK